MAEWHLEDLRCALEKRGWLITVHAGDDYRSSGTWELRRPRDTKAVWIDFNGLDDMRTLPVGQSYGCERRGTSIGLYFRRARAADIWKRELATFLESLEDGPTQ